MKMLEPRSRAHVRMVRYFLHVRNLPDSRLTKRIFNYDQRYSKFSTVSCWTTEVHKIMSNNGLEKFISNPGSKKEIIKLLTTSLLNRDLTYYYNSCLLFPKLRTYINIVNFQEPNVYLLKPLSQRQKSKLANFRLGVLPLRIETDRYSRPPLPVQQRICLNCNLNEIESEIHFALYCTKYRQIRQTLFNKTTIDKMLQDKEIIKLLVSDSKYVKLFAQFICECLEMRDMNN